MTAAAGGYRQWSGPARAMAQAVDAAVGACQDADAEAFAAALHDLRRADGEQLATLLGAVTADLIERGHPDGLDSEGAELLLRSCIRSGASWFDGLDSDALIRALTGALGVGDPAEDPQAAPAPSGEQIVSHGVLLIADLLTGLGEPLPPVLDQALRELMRAQTVELP